jgi:integrase
LKEAEKLCRVLRGQLDSDTFDWQKWIIFECVSECVYATDDLFARLAESYFISHTQTSSTQYTWDTNYMCSYRKLPVNKPITEALIIEWLQSIDSAGQRNKAIVAAKLLAKFLKIEVNFKDLRKSRQKKKLTPRDIPSDDEILLIRNKIDDPQWQWIFGLLAAYGLRNHEVSGLDFANYPDLIVKDTSKTGMRIVTPLYPEWADLWNLGKISYPSECDWDANLPNHKLGKKVTAYFYSQKLGITPYVLRHAWAARSSMFMNHFKAAKLMGHTVAVHEGTYHYWVNKQVYVDSAKEDIANKKGLIKVPGVD